MKAKRGAKTKDNLVKEIILLKKGNNKLTAKNIRDELVGLHPGSKLIPKERAIYKILERNKDKTISSDLDTPWSMGSCLKYGVSADVILPIQKQLLSYGRFETVRRARWYSLLHPILFPFLEKAYPEQVSQNQLRLHQIASFYTYIEQISEIDGEPYPDTRSLDNTFIINQDFSFETSIRLWVHLYQQIPEKPAKVVVSGQKAEQILGEQITPDEAKLLNEFISLLRAYEANEADLSKTLALVGKSPGMQPLVEKWMALSLRRDIKIIKMEATK